MGKWILDGWQIAVGPDIRILPGERASAEMLIVTHNADCAAYEERIAALECRLARIAALVKPVPVADLVDAGTEAPQLLAERHRQIRAILEDEG